MACRINIPAIYMVGSGEMHSDACPKQSIGFFIVSCLEPGIQEIQGQIPTEPSGLLCDLEPVTVSLNERPHRIIEKVERRRVMHAILRHSRCKKNNPSCAKSFYPLVQVTGEGTNLNRQSEITNLCYLTS